jgi:hypothetical protein
MTYQILGIFLLSSLIPHLIFLIFQIYFIKKESNSRLEFHRVIRDLTRIKYNKHDNSTLEK